MGHGHLLVLASWPPTAWEGETLSRDRVGLVLAVVVPISVGLSCHTSRQSITSQRPRTSWTHSRTRGCMGTLSASLFSFFDPYSSSYFSFVVFHIISFSSGLLLCLYTLSRRWSGRGAEGIDGCSWCRRSVQAAASSSGRESPNYEPSVVPSYKTRSLSCSIPPILPHRRRRGTPWYCCRHCNTPRQHTTVGLPYRWQVMYF